MRARTYRGLIAWQRAMSLAKGVYSLVKTMPNSERFGLASQMRRSAVSVPSNTAEGFRRENRSDFRDSSEWGVVRCLNFGRSLN